MSRAIDAHNLSEEVSSLQITIGGMKTDKGILADYAKSYKESVLRIIDEQATMHCLEPISIEESLPKKDGKYLAVMKGLSGRYYDTVYYAKCLSKIDEFDFEDMNYAGWYKYDSEYGYYEVTNVTHWMELPELPKDVNDENL